MSEQMNIGGPVSELSAKEVKDKKLSSSVNRKGALNNQVVIIRMLLFLLLFVPSCLFAYWYSLSYWSILLLSEKLLSVFAVVLVLLGSFLVSGSLYIIQETERAVVYRLGEYISTRGPGVIFVITGIETIASLVNVTTKRIHFVAAQTQTKDQVGVDAEGDIFYRIDPERAELSVTQVEDVNDSTKAAAEVSAKDMIGEVDLETLISDKEAVTSRMEESIFEMLNDWGVIVERLALTDVRPPEQLRDALASDALSKQLGRGRMELARMETEIAQELSKTSEFYTNNDVAFALRQISALIEMSKEGKGNSIVIPSDILKGFGGITTISKLIPDNTDTA